MRYVLRNDSDGQFLRQAGVWVHRLDEAMSFNDAGEAREFCQAHLMKHVQIVRCEQPYLRTLLAEAPPIVTGA